MCGFAFVLCFVVVFSQAASGSKVKADVYFEYLCSGSRAFFETQVDDVTKRIGDLVDFNFFPFGFAREEWVDRTFYNEETGEEEKEYDLNFACTHGTRECAAQMFMASAKAMLDKEQANQLIICLMKQNYYGPDRYKECVREVGIDARLVRAIANSTMNSEGKEYLRQIGQKHRSIKPSIWALPWVIFDDAYDQYVQSRSQNHFGQVICKQFLQKNVHTFPKNCTPYLLEKDEHDYDYDYDYDSESEDHGCDNEEEES